MRLRPAQRIIDHRDSIGGFTEVGQFPEVSGTGEKTFQSLASLVLCSHLGIEGAASLAARPGGGVMDMKSAARFVGIAAVALVCCVLALGHIVFGLGNFRPSYPVGEGIASIVAGVALIAALTMTRRSLLAALTTACLGTLPLVAWFAYAVPVQGSSTATLLWLSLILPVVTGGAALVVRRRTTRRRMRHEGHRAVGGSRPAGSRE